VRVRARVIMTAIATVIGFAALIALTVAVLLADGPLPGEVAYIRWWQRLGQPVPAFADIVRHTTSTEANVVVGLIPAVRVVRRYGRRGVAAVLICLTSMLAVQPVSKVLVDRERPTEEQVEVRRGHTSRSYPSGHSLSTTTVWGAFALDAWRRGNGRRGALLAVPIACTFVSGAIHGVHWPSDAVAGTIIGSFAAVLALRALRVVPPEPVG
jgi:membrane-associated phospholipid phosphatase